MPSFDYFRKILVYHILLVILAFLNFSWNTSRLKCRLIMIQSALENGVYKASGDVLFMFLEPFLASLHCFEIKESV